LDRADVELSYQLEFETSFLKYACQLLYMKDVGVGLSYECYLNTAVLFFLYPGAKRSRRSKSLTNYE